MTLLRASALAIAAASSVATAAPPGVPQATPLPPVFSKVVVIMLENIEFGDIIGNPNAPYFNSLAAQYGLAGKYFGVTHPSLPNYLATVGGDTFGFTSNCEDLSVCNIAAPFPSNLADQVEASGRTWKAYMESMPEACFIGSADPYAQRHNPFIYFDTIRNQPARCANIKPFSPDKPLAHFTWITPDLCNSMHDCSIATGDAWLQSVVPAILAQPDFQPGGAGVLFITFDEGFAANQVATLVISPLAQPGYVSDVPQDHFSLLRTIEESWSLPLLGQAGDAATNNMADFFVVTRSAQQTPPAALAAASASLR